MAVLCEHGEMHDQGCKSICGWFEGKARGFDKLRRYYISYDHVDRCTGGGNFPMRLSILRPIIRSTNSGRTPAGHERVKHKEYRQTYKTGNDTPKKATTASGATIPIPTGLRGQQKKNDEPSGCKITILCGCKTVAAKKHLSSPVTIRIPDR